MHVTGLTQVCMSIANPNKGTPSPSMHNAGFEALGLDFVYVAFEPADITSAIGAMRALGLRGCSISKPFKQDAVALVDRLDSVAAEIGAINTVVNDGGLLTGYNSDWLGCVRSLETRLSVDGLRIAVLGAGGAAAAAVFGLRRTGATVTIFNRSESKGAALAEARDVAFGGPLAAVSQGATFDVLVNATSVGREVDDESPVDLTSVDGVRLVMDMTFTRPDTTLLSDARSAGIDAVHGMDMLVAQGAFQFELFTGVAAPQAAMRDRLRADLFGSSP